MRAAEQRRKLGLHLCPCGQRAIKFMAGCWTCARCIRLDAVLYGSANGRGVTGIRYRDKGQITAAA